MEIGKDGFMLTICIWILDWKDFWPKASGIHFPVSQNNLGWAGNRSFELRDMVHTDSRVSWWSKFETPYFLVRSLLEVFSHQNEFFDRAARGIQVLITCSFGFVHCHIVLHPRESQLPTVVHFGMSLLGKHPGCMQREKFKNFKIS